jgi:CRP-like cAMP-binding protein
VKDLKPILAEHPFFEGLKPDYLELLVGCASNVRFDAGSYLCREGEEANRFFLIRHGKVAVQVHGGHLGPITLQTEGPGEIIGWAWLVPPHRWSVDVLALEMVRAIALDGKCLRGKCEENHDLGYELFKRFSSVVAERLDATRRQLLDVYGLRG